MTRIDCFEGAHDFLSNFYPCRIVYNGLTFKSTEAAYQAAKCKNPKDRNLFVNLEALESKKLGRRIDLREDWEDVKLNVMREVVAIKFAPGSRLARWLVETGDAELIEGNWWKDLFYGKDNKTWEGENWLGKILMEQRECLNGRT